MKMCFGPSALWSSPSAYYGAAGTAFRSARRFLYPCRCPFCGKVTEHVPCEQCEEPLRGLERSPVRRLSPSEHYLGRLEGAASVYHYKDAVRRAVLSAKYEGAAWYAEEFGPIMADRLFGAQSRMRFGVSFPQRALLEGAYDVIIPVPASGKERGYNIPQILSLPLAEALRIPMAAGVLSAAGKKRRQAGLSMEERLENAAGAFTVCDPEPAEGRRVLLADDVITTGATVSACAQALLDAGAESVFAISFAAADPGRSRGSSEVFKTDGIAE